MHKRLYDEEIFIFGKSEQAAKSDMKNNDTSATSNEAILEGMFSSDWPSMR